MANLDKTALLIAGLTAMLWGLTGVFVRLLPPFSPLTITACRLVIALLVGIAVLGLFRTARTRFKATLTLPLAYVLAILLAGYYLLATAAFQMAPVAEVALLLSTPPLFVLVLRRLANDIPNRFEVGGAALAIAGITLLMIPGLISADRLLDMRVIGDGLAICAAGLTGFYAFLYRRLAEQHLAPDAMGVTLLTFVLGSVLLMTLVGILPGSAAININAETMLLLVGLGIVSTAVPSLGFAVAAKRLPAVVAATISLLIPLFAGLFAWFILDERLSPMILPGGALVLTGVALILYRGRRYNISQIRN